MGEKTPKKAKQANQKTKLNQRNKKTPNPSTELIEPLKRFCLKIFLVRKENHFISCHMLTAVAEIRSDFLKIWINSNRKHRST